MLAALSRDLRSPLTAMRLRIEMLDETEDSVRLKALVEEMQVMVEATQEFARGVAKTEPAATVDLSAMLSDLVADVGGDPATLAPSSPVPATDRPHALNRALRNLIDNAVRYGGTAEVSLMQEPGLAAITVADKGPGLPEDQLEAVFEPFVRLEVSRNRDTGGVGLGLAIARTIIQAHGGTIELHNRIGGGLNAMVRLAQLLVVAIGEERAAFTFTSIMSADTFDQAEVRLILVLKYGNTDPAPEACPAVAKEPAAASAPAIGKRQAIRDQAQTGALPQPPDFSKPTHARFRAKLAQIVALAEAGDIAGLQAFDINPVSSCPKAMAPEPLAELREKS